VTEPNTPVRSSRQRMVLFLEVCLWIVVATGAYINFAKGRSASANRPAGYLVGSTLRAAQAPATVDVRRGAHLAFRNMAAGSDHGTLAFVPLDAPGGKRATTDLPCRRVSYSTGVLVCLGESRGQYSGYLLDDSLSVRQLFTLPGVPSRTRVSHNGAIAAYTVFTSADSYMSAGFSTRTGLVDVATGAKTADLERFAAERNGKPFRSVDFNYWGVTFTRDATRFFATLGTGGHTYLVEGEILTRRVTVLMDGIECPSLSPDETRIAFKKKTGAPGQWRPAVLDLETRTEITLPESRSIDDQIEWLDNDRLLYAVSERGAGKPLSAIWMVPANGTGSPTLLVPDAESPAVARASQ
jgi:hypothetical protein